MEGRLLLLTEGDRIKTLRLERGLSERKCARLSGISRSTLRAMEESSHVTKRSVEKLATLFGVEVSFLATFKGHMAEISGAA